MGILIKVGVCSLASSSGVDGWVVTWGGVASLGFTFDDLSVSSTASHISLVVPDASSSGFVQSTVSVIESGTWVVDTLSEWVGVLQVSHPDTSVSGGVGNFHVFLWEDKVPLLLDIVDVAWVLSDGQGTEGALHECTLVVGEDSIWADLFEFTLNPAINTHTMTVWDNVILVLGGPDLVGGGGGFSIEVTLIISWDVTGLCEPVTVGHVNLL